MIRAHPVLVHVVLFGLSCPLFACVQLPERLYACAPDGGCPEGYGCGKDDLCISESVANDAGVEEAVVSACSADVGQLRFRAQCPVPSPGCGAELEGTWCTTGACLPLQPFPGLDQLCRDNGVSGTWSGHSGTVRGGRVYVSDGGTYVYARRDEQVDLSVDVLLSGPCIPGGDCVDTASAMQLAQPGVTAVCAEQGAGCRCILRWSALSRSAGEVQGGDGQYSEIPGGAAWKVCAGSSTLELAPDGATPALVYTYERP